MRTEWEKDFTSELNYTAASQIVLLRLKNKAYNSTLKWGICPIDFTLSRSNSLSLLSSPFLLILHCYQFKSLSPSPAFNPASAFSPAFVLYICHCLLPSPDTPSPFSLPVVNPCKPYFIFITLSNSILSVCSFPGCCHVPLLNSYTHSPLPLLPPDFFSPATVYLSHQTPKEGAVRPQRQFFFARSCYVGWEGCRGRATLRVEGSRSGAGGIQHLQRSRVLQLRQGPACVDQVESCQSDLCCAQPNWLSSKA